MCSSQLYEQVQVAGRLNLSTAWLLFVVIHKMPIAQLYTLELTHKSQLTLQQQCTPRVHGSKAHSSCGHQQLVEPYLPPQSAKSRQGGTLALGGCTAAEPRVAALLKARIHRLQALPLARRYARARGCGCRCHVLCRD